VIRSLGKFPGVTGKLDGVALLGHPGQLPFTHETEGLVVRLPGEKPCDYAVALKITGERLREFKPELAAPQVAVIQPDAASTIVLSADDAQLHGNQVKVEEKDGKSNIGFWDRADESASWKVNFKQPGRYKLTACLAAVAGDALAIVEVDDHQTEIRPTATGAWDKFTESEVGTIEISQDGEHVVKVKSHDAQSWKPINLRWIKLIRVGS
jgi:hypothetical protein